MALALPNLRTMSMEAATFYEMFPHLRPSVAEGSTPAPPPPAYWRTFRQTARHITTLILYNFSELQAAAFLPFFPSLESLSISRFFREHDAPREDGTPFYTAVSNLDHLHTLKLSAPSLSYAKPDMRAPPSLRTLMFFPTDWSAATWHILEAFAPGLESLTVSTPSRSAGPPPILSLPRLQTLFTGSPTIIHALASSPLHYLSFLAHHNVRTLNAITDEMLFPFLPTLETVALDALLARDHPLEAALTALLERKPSLAIERPAPKSAVWADARRWFNPSWRPYDQNPSTEPPRYRDVEPEEQAGERREEGYQVAKGLLRFYDNLVERQYVQGDDVGLLTTLVNLSEANENAAWDRA
ncbi:hypothetical protein MNV49_004406 [Pseudohyphozyma bogoriensis]|nr:hypothetical protein MNV49_004406 [Pseudohyphozyma bogoriensis]